MPCPNISSKTQILKITTRCVFRSGQTDLGQWNSIKESGIYVINVIKRKGSNEKKVKIIFTLVIYWMSTAFF